MEGSVAYAHTIVPFESGGDVFRAGTRSDNMVALEDFVDCRRVRVFPIAGPICCGVLM